MDPAYSSSEAWFELPSSARINAEIFNRYLLEKKWKDYSEHDKNFKGYAGIGLTSRSTREEHLDDSLGVLQSIGTYEAEASDYNWQKISVWNQNVDGIVEKFFSNLTLQPQRARFSKLSPRSTIPRHIDDFSENITRVHWPIVTDQNNFFCFYSGTSLAEKFHMPAGRAFAVNTAISHGFINFSKVVERIHLIINFEMSFRDFQKWTSNHGLFKKNSEMEV